MAQILNFRNFLFLPSYKPTTHFRLRFLSTLVSSSSSSSSRRSNINAPPLHLRRRSTTPMEVEENSSVGFNKRRAEGTENSGLPKKNLQLKVRKLNPINTISYVQVMGWFYFFPFMLQKFSKLLLYLFIDFYFYFRFWVLEWILKIHHLLLCFSLINKDSSLMLGR